MKLVNSAILSAVLVGNPDVRAAKHQDHKGHANQSPVTASSPLTPEHPSSQPITNDKQKQASPETVRVLTMPNKDWSDWVIFGGNILVVIVGIGGVIIAVYTLRHIESQTAAIKKQTEHMVESERPFLMIEVLGDENHVTFKVSNQGRSPAKILFIDRMLNPTYLPIGENPSPVPDYGQQYRNIIDSSIHAEPVNAEWIPQGEHTFIGSVSPKSELLTLRSSLPPQSQTVSSAIWHFGVIVYKGLFGPAYYESRYCYRLLDNQWMMLGPYGYNEYK